MREEEAEWCVFVVWKAWRRSTPCDSHVRVPDEVPEGRKIGICE
jgi:hypothetical protein